MGIPALIWGGTKLAALFYGASAADDAITGGNIKKGGKWGLSQIANKALGGLGYERVEPVATNVQIEGVPGSANGNGGQNTGFNNAVLDTATGEVKPAEEQDYGMISNLMTAYDKFQKGDVMGAFGSVSNAFKNEDGDLLNAKTGMMGAAGLGGIFALRNMLSGKGPNKGFFAPLLLVVTAAFAVMNGINALNNDDKPTHDDLADNKLDNLRAGEQNQQPRYQSIEELAM